MFCFHDGPRTNYMYGLICMVWFGSVLFCFVSFVLLCFVLFLFFLFCYVLVWFVCLFFVCFFWLFVCLFGYLCLFLFFCFLPDRGDHFVLAASSLGAAPFLSVVPIELWDR